MLLMAEMAIFMLLIVPLPYTWKRKLFTFISESPLIAKLQYGLRVTLAQASMEEPVLRHCRSRSYSY
jgi:hypothetical protein